MKRWGSLVVVVSLVSFGSLVGCKGDGSEGDDGVDRDAAATEGEPEGLIGITDAHNIVRENVDTPDPLPPLTWDGELAATAAAWIAGCQDNQDPAGLLDHNPNRGNVGENIFAATAGATGLAAVDSWAAEEANYDYHHNMCNKGTRVCGHYTQIVWRTTTKVGCAIGTCANHTYGSIVVCNYSPAGNIERTKPY